MNYLNILLKNYFSIVLFLIGAGALVLSSGYSLGYYLICFAGIASWLKARGRLLSSNLLYLYIPILTYALVNLLFSLYEKWAMRDFNTYLPFVLIVFGIYGIRYYKPRADWFWAGLAVGALGASILAGYQSIVLGMRAGGNTHPIQFGNIALLMGVLCLVRALVELRWTLFCALMCCGFVAGCAASIWSQTRGGWLAVLMILAWVVTKAATGWSPVRRGITAVALLLFLMASVLHPGSKVQGRVTEAAAELNAFFTLGKQDTAVGSRLAMWTLGVEGVKNAGLFGHGAKGWIDARDAAVADGRLDNFSSEFTHLHNEYLDVTFKRGLIGLLLYLALYLVPMWMFFKPYLNKSNSSPETRALALAGMVIPMMFMDFGLTQTFLSHNSGRIILCSLWTCSAALIINSKELLLTIEGNTRLNL